MGINKTDMEEGGMRVGLGTYYIAVCALLAALHENGSGGIKHRDVHLPHAMRITWKISRGVVLGKSL